MRNALLLALASALPFVAGCSDGFEEPVVCTTELRHSVRVTVIDAGISVDDADVSYSVDGSALTDCDALGTLYVCGAEQSGNFLLVATRGDRTGTTEVEVLSDECHVMTEDVSITLEPQAHSTGTSPAEAG
jgi:hypothetical protein